MPNPLYFIHLFLQPHESARPADMRIISHPVNKMQQPRIVPNMPLHEMVEPERHDPQKRPADPVPHKLQRLPVEIEPSAVVNGVARMPALAGAGENGNEKSQRTEAVSRIRQPNCMSAQRMVLPSKVPPSSLYAPLTCVCFVCHRTRLIGIQIRK